MQATMASQQASFGFDPEGKPALYCIYVNKASGEDQRGESRSLSAVPNSQRQPLAKDTEWPFIDLGQLLVHAPDGIRLRTQFGGFAPIA